VLSLEQVKGRKAEGSLEVQLASGLKAAARAGQMKRHEMHTLLIEPNTKDRDCITDALHHAGQRVTGVGTQEEGLALLRENFYDLIVLAAPPKGQMDLPALLRAFHWRWPKSLVIILADAGELPAVVAACGGAADGLAVKPINREELRRVIEGAVHRERLRWRDSATEQKRNETHRQRVIA
jgi:DNA-binding NtrC family response regulator